QPPRERTGAEELAEHAPTDRPGVAPVEVRHHDQPDAARRQERDHRAVAIDGAVVRDQIVELTALLLDPSEAVGRRAVGNEVVARLRRGRETREALHLHAGRVRLAYGRTADRALVGIIARR